MMGTSSVESGLGLRPVRRRKNVSVEDDQRHPELGGTAVEPGIDQHHKIKRRHGEQALPASAHPGGPINLPSPQQRPAKPVLLAVEVGLRAIDLRRCGRRRWRATTGLGTGLRSRRKGGEHEQEDEENGSHAGNLLRAVKPWREGN